MIRRGWPAVAIGDELFDRAAFAKWQALMDDLRLGGAIAGTVPDPREPLSARAVNDPFK